MLSARPGLLCVPLEGGQPGCGSASGPARQSTSQVALAHALGQACCQTLLGTWLQVRLIVS